MYVLCIGALKVFVYDKILMLIAAHEYNYDEGAKADAENEASLKDIYQHLTNTARNVEDNTFVEADNVQVR